MAWLIYIIGTINAFLICCSFFMVATGVCSIAIIIVYFTEAENFTKDFKKLKYVLYSFVVFTLLVVFVPNSKTIAAMYLIPKITENDQVKELPDKTLKIINLKLDQWIQDLSEKKGRNK